MKKLLLFFMALIAGTSALCAQIYDYDFIIDDIYYRIEPDGVAMNVANGKYWDLNNSIDLVIPETVTWGGTSYPIVAIDSNCFHGTSLTSVTMPSSIKTIGHTAFCMCSKLKSVKLSESITEIEPYTFYNCQSLTSIRIPDFVESIGEEAFRDCPLEELYIGASLNSLDNIPLNNIISLELSSENNTYSLVEDILYDKGMSTVLFCCKNATSAKLPASVTRIAKAAFYRCTSLASVNLPPSLTEIGDSAFENCDALKSINIGNSVTKIGAWAFGSCDSLESVSIGSSLTTIGRRTFSGCKSLTSIDIPDNITTLEQEAFYNCEALKSIRLSNSISKINERVFAWCTSLESIYIPDNVQTIGEYAFSLCHALKDIKFGNGLETIESGAFGACKALKTLTLPSSLKTIGGWVFQNCENLESVSFSSAEFTMLYAGVFLCCGSLKHVDLGNVTAIGNIFEDCFNLESIYLPKTVSELYNLGAPNLTQLEVDPENPVYTSKDNIVYTKDMKKLVYCAPGKTSAEIDENTIELGQYSFSQSKITSLVIPDKVETIGQGVFVLSKLAAVTIGESVKYIDQSAFIGLVDTKGISVINCKARQVPVCSEAWNVFDNPTFENAVLYVPENLIDSYREAAVWKNFATIEKKDFSTGVNYDIEADGGLFNITSADDMTVEIIGAMLSPDSPPASKIMRKAASAAELNIPESIEWHGKTYTVVSIGRSAFEGMDITSVEIPATVNTIRDRAFAGARSIMSVKCNAIVPPTCGENVWEAEVKANATLNVPEGTVDAYKNAPSWSDFKKIADSGSSGIDIEAVEETRIEIIGTSIVVNGSGSSILCEIFDTNGQTVYSGYGSNTISHLPKGVYIVRVGDKSQKVII